MDLKKSPSDWKVEEAKMSHIMANWKNRADATPPHSNSYKIYPKLNTILLWHQFGSKRSKVVTPQAETVHHPRRAVYFIDVYGIGRDVEYHTKKSTAISVVCWLRGYVSRCAVYIPGVYQ